ncbi:Rho GTPase activation protein [Wolfiporia cocos MD-104 SS10]|uniref:Rho GTPase activation protein n=1 Tax=Wolfiporia cocos (strain MD-104) TaxID=742152 RepID=A0A2H3JJ16_WOLCO|nr:Rho GTPase activation protein [Wolfiporia cocos MD-104 SS10]
MSYIRFALGSQISRLVENESLDMDIEPLRVYRQAVARSGGAAGPSSPSPVQNISSELAATHSGVQASIAQHAVLVMQTADVILSSILDSVGSVPYEIRWVCKQVKVLVRRQFPPATDDALASLIGEFFFARYVNPALVTPQAYGLIQGVPRQNPRRTLTTRRNIHT